MTRQIPEPIAERLKLLLAAIAKLFRASRITLIVRAPEEGNALGTLVMGNDSPTEAIQALREHMAAEAKRFAAEGARSGQSPDAEFPKYRNLDEIR